MLPVPVPTLLLLPAPVPALLLLPAPDLLLSLCLQLPLRLPRPLVLLLQWG